MGEVLFREKELIDLTQEDDSHDDPDDDDDKKLQVHNLTTK
jgi:hypothetical protein